MLFFFFNKFIYLFVYFWLCWVFVSVRGLSLVAASGDHSSSRCAGLSLSRPLLLQSTGSRRAGSVVVAHGPSCSAACGILPGQGSNPCPLHWQADSQPLRHQGSPAMLLSTAAVPNLFGTRDQFCGRQFFHRPGRVGGRYGPGGDASDGHTSTRDLSTELQPSHSSFWGIHNK